MAGVVLVTGGCGFIGTWVLRAVLDRGGRAVVVDQQPVPSRWQSVLGQRAHEVVRVDASVVDRDDLVRVIASHGVERIIHLAALLTPACQADPWRGCQVNVLGTTAVFDAARVSGRVRRVACASSYAVHAAGSDGDESPPNFYGVFKQAAEQVAARYWEDFGIASLSLRPHVVYGPEREVGLTAGPSLAARAAARGESYTIGYTGRAGYVYVEDTARALVDAAIGGPDGATIADLPGESATPEEIVTRLTEIVPQSAGKIRVSGPPIPMNQARHPQPIERFFPGWKETTLDAGLRQTVAFYRGSEDRP